MTYSLIEIKTYSIRCYRKTQMNVLANPILTLIYTDSSTLKTTEKKQNKTLGE